MCRIDLGDGKPIEVKTAKQKSDLLRTAIEAAKAGKIITFRRHSDIEDLFLLWSTEPPKKILLDG